MKRFALAITIVLYSLASHGQINQRGVPFIKNFSPEEYEASTQNWAVAQDHRGVMYFGNNDDGVLEYDGKTWRKIPVPNKANVRSLAVDSLGTVYVGTVGDFGYLTPNEKGELVYESLRHLITDSINDFSDIWKTYVFKGNVYFFCTDYLFRFDGSKIKVFDVGPQNVYYNHLAYVSNDHFYMSSFIEGFRELVDDSVVLAPGAKFFARKRIWAIIPSTDSTSTVVTSDGLYKYNQNTGEAKLFENNNKFFKKTLDDAMPYNAIGLADANIGVAYVFGENYSFAKVNSSGYPLEVINKANGLQDETVTYLYQKYTIKGSSPLWLGLNSGISRSNIHSPYRRFGEESGIRGGILDVIKFNNTIFVATFSGVFYLTFDENGLPRFQNIPEISSAAWTFTKFIEPNTKKERLLIGTLGAIYDVDANLRITNISESEEFKGKIAHLCYTLQQSSFNPSVVNIGIRGGMARMYWKDNAWHNMGMARPEGYNFVGEVRKIAEEKNGNVWVCTYINGIKHIEFDGENVKITDYDTQHGLPDVKDNFVYSLNDSIVFATSMGLMRFDKTSNIFIPASLFGSKGKNIDYGVSRIIPYQDGFLTSSVDNNIKKIELHKIDEGGNYVVVDTPFKPISGKTPDAIYADNSGILWFGMSTDVISFDPNVDRNYSEPFNVLIRKVTTKGDSVLFSGTYFDETPEGIRTVSEVQNPKQIPTLPFSLNSFVFDIAAPFFEHEEHTEYSFLLEGNDKEWSKWTTDPKPIYTNIPEGSYIFKAKARNIFGIESNTAEYRFTITPPWYRSIVALIGYVLLLAGFIWGIVVLNTRRLIAEKERLEQIVRERTAEVVAQKEELEIQRDKIFEQNEEIKSSINYASRIQTALLTPVETLNSMFEEYFILYLPRDIVSGDFYWQSRIGNRKICVVADCTGHGVPGGFMSMLGMGFLTQITIKSEKLTASQILDQLRAQIIISLHQTGKAGENKDGMDLALYIIDEDTGTLEFAGANNPLILIRDNEVIQIKGDKMPIGIHIKCDTPFTNNIMDYRKGDILYTFSDGYVDQFGGPDLRKFMIKNLKDLLLEIHMKPMEEQREILHKTIVDWQGETPRIDDIVMMGVRL